MSFGIHYDIGRSPAEFIKFWSDQIYQMPSTKDAAWDTIIKSCLQLQPNNRGIIADLLKSPFYEMIQGQFSLYDIYQNRFRWKYGTYFPQTIPC